MYCEIFFQKTKKQKKQQKTKGMSIRKEVYFTLTSMINHLMKQCAILNHRKYECRYPMSENVTNSKLKKKTIHAQISL